MAEVVHIVEVLERDGGIYIFEREEDAKAFAAVVEMTHIANREEQVPMNQATAAGLIRQELGE